MLKGPEPLAVAELAPLRLAPVHTRESLKPGKDVKTTPFAVPLARSLSRCNSPISALYSQ